MKNSLIKLALLWVIALGLSACGDDNKKPKAMILNQEYPYTADTKITNTANKPLVIEKKYYWDSQTTVVVLKEGSATIK